MEQASRFGGRRPWAVLGGLAAALVSVTAACGDDDDSSAPTDEGAEQADATLEVEAFEFDDVTAPAGGTLSVANLSGAPHTVTADDGAFDEELGDGETITIQVPAEAGDYRFHCEIHPSMAATLTVE